MSKFSGQSQYKVPVILFVNGNFLWELYCANVRCDFFQPKVKIKQEVTHTSFQVFLQNSFAAFLKVKISSSEEMFKNLAVLPNPEYAWKKKWKLMHLEWIIGIRPV